MLILLLFVLGFRVRIFLGFGAQVLMSLSGPACRLVVLSGEFFKIWQRRIEPQSRCAACFFKFGNMLAVWRVLSEGFTCRALGLGFRD